MLAITLLTIAGPTYLQCELKLEGVIERIAISTDEATGRATVQTNAGRVQERMAAYDALKVTIPDHPTVLIIDRVKLTLRREWPSVSDATPESGKCEITKPPTERAF